MGRLTLPPSGIVYADANIALYTINGHPVCVPLWQTAQQGSISVVSSELTLLEILVTPIRLNDPVKLTSTLNFWNRPSASLLPITQDILREAARLRALFNLKTPDALHAATAILHGCALFVTNDPHFRRVPNLPLVILDDVLAAP